MTKPAKADSDKLKERRKAWDAWKVSPESINELCSHIIDCGSLREFARAKGFAVVTLYDWIEADVNRAEQYARAREKQAESFAADLVDLAQKAHGLDSAGVNAVRLEVDTRKWIASKMLPRKYGDFQRTELSGELGVKLTSDQRRSRIAEIARILGGGIPAPAGGGIGVPGKD